MPDMREISKAIACGADRSSTPALALPRSIKGGDKKAGLSSYAIALGD